MIYKKNVIFLCVGILLISTQKVFSEQSIHSMDAQKASLISPYGVVTRQDFTKIPHAIVEEVQLYPQVANSSDQRIERKGVLVRYPNAEGTILVCHGFMCDKFDVAFLRNIFPKKKFNIMTFDFRAHGEKNDGQYCTFGRDEALDVQSAALFLRQHPDLKNSPLFVYGFSMGAVAAIEAQSCKSVAQEDGQNQKSLFDAMILDCPFDSSKNLIRKGLSNLKFTILGKEFNIPGRETLERYAFHPYVQTFLKTVLKAISKMDSKNIQTNICHVSPKKSIRNVTVPCFFIHCKNDELVPVDAVKKIYERAQGYKELWLTDGRRHYDSLFYAPEQYAQKIKLFLYKVLNGNVLPSHEGGVIEDGKMSNDDLNIQITEGEGL